MKSNMAKRSAAIALASAMAITAGGTIPGGILKDTSVVKAAGIEALYIDSADYYNDAYDKTWAYDGNDLGCTYSAKQTVFKVWSPESDAMKLNLYATGSDKETGSKKLGTYDMTKMKGSDGKWNGVWEYTLDGDQKNVYYTYRATVSGEVYPEAVDPYAKAVGVNGNRAMVVDLNSTNPEGWDTNYKSPAMKLSDAIIWEVDIRDFSISASSGVSEGNRGKYLAFTENTTVNSEGKIASCVDYLKKMGVTHVQVLPAFDFDGVDETTVSTSPSDENYNWGYNPKNYNAPDGSYSTNPYDGNVRIKEMKQMIQALHNAGIQVVMDVVYNHTGATADSNFNKIMPDYYYKVMKSGDKVMYDDQSECGNATRSTGAMFEKYMTDSLTYWAEEYHIDGFRFDLMGIHDWKTMNNIRASLNKKFGDDAILMYGEGWTGGRYDEGTSCYKTYCRNLDQGIGYFNDQIRDGIKGETGPFKISQIGFAQQNLGLDGKSVDGEKSPASVFAGVMGSVGMNTSNWWMWRAYWADTSNRVLSYDSCHDNQTIWDKFVESIGEKYNTTSSTSLNMSRMAAGYLLTSHGGTFLCGGEEFARTKNGNENSYNCGDTDNAIDWSRVATYANLTSYYQGMVDIRKAFSGFRTVYTETGVSGKGNDLSGFRVENVKDCNLTPIADFIDVAGTEVNAYNEVAKKNEDTVADGVLNSFGYYLSNNVSGEWSQVAVLMNNTTKDKTVNLTAADGSSQWVLVSDGRQASVEGVSTTDGATVTVPGKSLVVAVPKNTFDAVQKKASATAIVEKVAEPTDPMMGTDKPAATAAPGTSDKPSVTEAPQSLTVSEFTTTPSSGYSVGNAVKMSANAAVVTGSAKYRFYVYSGEKVVKSSNWTTSNTFVWTPAKAGTYTLCVAVRDDVTQIEKMKKITVTGKLSASVKASASSVKKGKTVTFTASAKNGQASYTYAFTIKDANGKTVKTVKASKKASYKWKATKKGTFTATVTVKDKAGKKATATSGKVTVK